MTRNEQRKLNRKKRLAQLLIAVAIDCYNDMDYRFFTERIEHAEMLFNELGMEKQAIECEQIVSCHNKHRASTYKFHHRPYIARALSASERKEIVEYLDDNEFAADNLIELFWIDED